MIISHVQMLGLRLWCLAEISDFSGRWKVPTTGTGVFMFRCSVSGRGVWQKSVIFQDVGRCPQRAQVYFCHFKAPTDSPLLFQTRRRRGISFASFQVVGKASCYKLHEKKRSPLSSWVAVIPLVIAKVILHHNPPLSHLSHTSHEGFLR